jgi:hypothetical protein
MTKHVKTPTTETLADDLLWGGAAIQSGVGGNLPRLAEPRAGIVGPTGSRNSRPRPFPPLHCRRVEGTYQHDSNDAEPREARPQRGSRARLVAGKRNG